MKTELKEFIISKEAYDALKISSLRQGKIYWYICQQVSKYVNWDDDNETLETIFQKMPFEYVSELPIKIPSELLVSPEFYTNEEIVDDFMSIIRLTVQWKKSKNHITGFPFVYRCEIDGNHQMTIYLTKTCIEWLVGPSENRKFCQFTLGKSSFKSNDRAMRYITFDTTNVKRNSKSTMKN